MKKYELTNNYKEYGNLKVYQIRALKSFGNVKEGELGGFIEKDKNLSHKGDAWVSDNAMVYGNARVSDNAMVYGSARVSGNAEVSGDAWVSGDADYTTIKGFGTAYRNTTFFRTKDSKICVVCGCFSGTIEEFREQVNRTRSVKIAKEYLAIADLMEEHFKD